MASPYSLVSLPGIDADRVLHDYEGLTFPPLERQLGTRRWRGELVGAAVHGVRGPVGLGLATYTTTGEARVLSLAVLPGDRRRGIGGLLLTTLESEVAGRGVTLLQGSYRTSWRSREAIERLLARSGWGPAETRLLIGRGETRRSTPLVAALAAVEETPEETEVFGWEALREHEREAALAALERGDAPASLSPFQVAGRLDTGVSVGLRWRGELAGWLVCHRLDFATIQYTSLWVRPDLRGHGLARLLAAEALRRRLADPDLRYGVFLVHPDNAAMRRFAEAHLVPRLVTWSELRVARKRLG